MLKWIKSICRRLAWKYWKHRGLPLTESGRDLFLYDILEKVAGLEKVAERSGKSGKAGMFVIPHNSGYMFIMRFSDGHKIGEYFDSRENLEVFLKHDLFPCIAVKGKTGHVPTFDDMLKCGRYMQ